jgi:hypothetical protein
METIHHDGRVITVQQVTRTPFASLLYSEDSGEYIAEYIVSVGSHRMSISGYHTLTSEEVAAYKAGTLDVAELGARMGDADQASGRYEQKPRREE